MHKAFSAAVASLLLVTSAIGTPAVADSRHHSRFDRHDRVVQNYYGNHSDNSCRDWDHNRNGWDDAHYQRWYRDHYRHRDFRANDALAVMFGFAVGVIGGATTRGVWSAHAAACDNRFRSYDHRTDTYLGYDGMRHYCTL